MTQVLPGGFTKMVKGSGWKACLVAAVALTMCMAGNESAQATTGSPGIAPNPYVVPEVKNGSIEPNTVETYIVADEGTVDIGNGNGLMTKVMAFKSCSDAGLIDCTRSLSDIER